MLYEDVKAEDMFSV